MNKPLLISILFILFISNVYCQTSGPSTPEVQKFTPASVNNLVNLFTGDFNYNIPLFELDGGYPITLSYTSGAQMNEEASNVGLGWQLNIGRINRTVRGFPDDFNGDRIIKRLHQKEELNIGIGVGIDAEFFGSLNAGVTTGLSFSNLRGLDLESNLSASFKTGPGDLSLSAGLSLNVSSKESASISPNVGLKYKYFNVEYGGKISTIEGVKYSGYSLSFQKEGNSKLTASFPLSMAKIPFTPRIEFPTKNISGSFKIRFGPEFWGLSTGASAFGQFSKQYYPKNERVLKSFGYLYLQHKLSQDAIIDMASEKESPIFEDDPNLYLSFLTNDVFSVSAQGLSGTFRPFRKDIGIIHSENQSSNDHGGNIGIEIHPGSYYHYGIDVVENIVNNYSGNWRNENQLNLFKFKEFENGNSVYFKNLGETNSFRNQSVLENHLGGTNAIKFEVGNETIINNSNIIASKCDKTPEYSNYAFQYLTAAEAELALIPIKSYSGHGKNTTVININRFDRNNGPRKGHHISNITILRDDGVKYEFGIPAYNTYHRDVSFNVNGKGIDKLYDQYTEFDPSDNSLQNDKGTLNYYSSTETPPYAYAYLLTGVYSPDYVDITGDGPTSDDLGTYTRFNYNLESTNFKWQTPSPMKGVQLNPLVSYNRGNLCDNLDDVGSYINGTKEIWQIHSIETKNYIAEFYSSPRQDGKEQSLQNNTKFLSKIDSIKIFSRSEFINTQGTTNLPMKTVYLDYSYSLCQSLPSNINSGGKLILKNVKFKNYSSRKSMHSYYSFNYYNEDSNLFKYNTINLDTWGELKNNTIGPFNNVRYPYSEQDLLKSQLIKGGWNLKSIALPTGGQIEVEYEPKDYAYVQDKPAMQMYKVIGFSSDGIDTSNLNELNESNLWILIDIGLNNGDVKKYLKNNEKLYLDCIVNAGENANINLEQISGFFDYESSKMLGNNVLAIKLKLGQYNTNPVSYAFWQKMRKNLSHVMYPPIIKPGNSPMQNILTTLKSIPKQVPKYLELLKSYKSIMLKANRATKLIPQYGSFIRLYNPNGKKLGGGSRVKKILFKDNWDKMTNGVEPAATYGKIYRYSIILNNGKDTISSGIATYEPIGNEENPFYKFSGEYNNANTLAPELYYYKTEPFGESFFPSPSIGYSKVLVSDLQDPEVTKHSTGFEIFEFYTSKDFPTITKRTSKSLSAQKVNKLFINQNKITASQGFLIELNDMHGKLKSHKNFSKLDSLSPIFGIEYIYKMKNGNLDNLVSTINPENGLISNNKLVGMDYDFYIASKESRNLVKSPALQINLDVIPIIFGIPLPVPMMLPNYAENLLQFKGVTTTKVIYRTGILDEIKSYENGKELITKNVLYDEWSGNVVVNSVGSEFKTNQYNLLIPSYWYYKQMGLGSINSNTIISKFNSKDINELNLLEGDKLLLWSNSNTVEKGWIYRNSNGMKSIIDAAGNQLNQNLYYKAKVIATGFKNMQSNSSSTLILDSNPVKDKKLNFDIKVLSANFIEYGQQWKAYYAKRPNGIINSCHCENINWEMPTIQFNADATIKSPNNYFIDEKIIKIVSTSDFPTKKSGIQGRYRNSNSNPIENELISIILDKEISKIKKEYLEGSYMLFTSFLPLKEDDFCKDSYKAEGQYKLINSKNQEILKGNYIIENQIVKTRECYMSVSSKTTQSCRISIGDPVNPFIAGLLGNWRPSATYMYLSDRAYLDNTLLENQGYYSNKFSIIKEPSKGFFIKPASMENWQLYDSITVHDPSGNVINVFNGLKLPQSIIYGYRNRFPSASASNAEYYEIGSDNFEDYDSKVLLGDTLNACHIPEHFKFSNIDSKVISSTTSTKSAIFDSISHSGRRCLFIPKGEAVSLSRKVINSVKESVGDKTKPIYALQANDILMNFTPLKEQSYILNLWINESKSIDQLDSSLGRVSVSFKDANNHQLNPSVIGKSSGPVIENWQQIELIFSVPIECDSVVIKLHSDNSTHMLVDDVRISPLKSMLKSYVYDPIKLRLMAVLDEQNYASFYEYDDEGHLTRIKKETEAGIITTEEIKHANPKNSILEHNQNYIFPKK